MQAGLLQGNSDGPFLLPEFAECPLRGAKFAPQEKKNRRFLRNRAPSIVMENAPRARCVAVKIDGRMSSPARTGRVAKVLFRIATSRIENSQSEIICAL